MIEDAARKYIITWPVKPVIAPFSTCLDSVTDSGTIAIHSSNKVAVIAIVKHIKFKINMKYEVRDFIFLVELLNSLFKIINVWQAFKS